MKMDPVVLKTFFHQPITIGDTALRLANFFFLNLKFKKKKFAISQQKKNLTISVNSSVSIFFNHGFEFINLQTEIPC